MKHIKKSYEAFVAEKFATDLLKGEHWDVIVPLNS